MQPSLCPDAPPATAGGWRRERRELYHGIPVVLAAAGCPDAAWDDAWQLLIDADAVFNRFAPGSEISRLAGLADADGFQPSPLLAHGIRAALRARALTVGANDASLRPLVGLWRRAVDEQRWPAAVAIDAALARCRLRDLAVDDGGRLRVTGAPWAADLDLGGVIKGVLVDLVALRLRAAGVADLLAQIGGETTVLGRSPSGRPWRIGVQHPLVEDATWLVLCAPPAGLSCSTSADYRRGRDIAGTPVSHLLDPRSGLPASADLLTAHAVIPACARCGDAEALSKAVALLDREAADAAVGAAGGEWLHLEAGDDGIAECRSRGLARLVEAA